MGIPPTINEEASAPDDKKDPRAKHKEEVAENGSNKPSKMKRTPQALYHIPNTDENTPLLGDGARDGPKASELEAPEDDSAESGSSIVTVAIYINLAANIVLLIGKIVVIVLTSSLSVLASLVDAALDFLSTAIVWTTTKMISHKDQHKYPVGRRRLEPIGVLVFSVIMITAFFQVALQCFQRLISDDRSIVQLTAPSIIIMASTVIIKFGCWLWCRLIKNSSVQALAQDAMTDVVFNIFSIIFPIGTPSLFHLLLQPHLLISRLFSRLLRLSMVPRRSWRSSPLLLRHIQLGAHFRLAYSQPYRRCRIS